MTSIKEIESALANVTPGTVIMIRGYMNSDGDRQDLEVEILPKNGYLDMQREDLKLLRDADLGDLYDEESDLQLTDLITAREQLITSREASIANAEGDTPPIRKGPDYIAVGPSTAKHPDNLNALYIRGLKVTSDAAPTPKPAKGAIPRAKQQLAAKLNLPTARYIHNVKLELGKFEDVTIFE